MQHLQKQLQTNTLTLFARLNAAATYDKLNDMMHSEKDKLSCTTLDMVRRSTTAILRS